MVEGIFSARDAAKVRLRGDDLLQERGHTSVAGALDRSRRLRQRSGRVHCRQVASRARRTVCRAGRTPVDAGPKSASGKREKMMRKPLNSAGVISQKSVSGDDEREQMTADNARPIIRFHSAPASHDRHDDLALPHRSEARWRWAFSLLEQEFQRHSSFLWWLRSVPLFEPIRSDPRYHALLRRMGFPAG